MGHNLKEEINNFVNESLEVYHVIIMFSVIGPRNLVQGADKNDSHCCQEDNHNPTTLGSHSNILCFQNTSNQPLIFFFTKYAFDFQSPANIIHYLMQFKDSTYDYKLEKLQGCNSWNIHMIMNQEKATESISRGVCPCLLPDGT